MPFERIGDVPGVGGRSVTASRRGGCGKGGGGGFAHLSATMDKGGLLSAICVHHGYGEHDNWKDYWKLRPSL